MQNIKLGHLLLLTVAAIWGFAFVAQSSGMEHLGPHSFNAARFILAALSLAPLLLLFRRDKTTQSGKILWLGGLLAGSVMFAGFSFQQQGLLYTTAGNAGFITSMYIVIVPLLGLLARQRTSGQAWIGIALAVVGLYVLSVDEGLTMSNKGDQLELIGAFFWAIHVISIGWLSSKVDAISFSIVQFVVAAVWASGFAMALETPVWGDFMAASGSLLYAGIASSGIACTIQIIGQRDVSAGAAALILSLEAVFAVIGGWLLLDEQLDSKQLVGCAIMLAGILLSQLPSRRAQPSAAVDPA